ncbi:hypothetical protein ABTA95_20580, partial [Acinetobacter baumannii]
DEFVPVRGGAQGELELKKASLMAGE